MFGGKGPSIILPPTAGPGKSLALAMILILVGAVVLGVVLSGSDIFSPKKTITVERAEAEPKVVQEIVKDKEPLRAEGEVLLIWLLIVYIAGLITAMTLLAPRYRY